MFILEKKKEVFEYNKDDELFQIKMLICAKLKISSINNLVLTNQITLNEINSSNDTKIVNILKNNQIIYVSIEDKSRRNSKSINSEKRSLHYIEKSTSNNNSLFNSKNLSKVIVDNEEEDNNTNNNKNLNILDNNTNYKLIEENNNYNRITSKFSNKYNKAELKDVKKEITIDTKNYIVKENDLNILIIYNFNISFTVTIDINKILSDLNLEIIKNIEKHDNLVSKHNIRHCYSLNYNNIEIYSKYSDNSTIKNILNISKLQDSNNKQFIIILNKKKLINNIKPNDYAKYKPKNNNIKSTRNSTYKNCRKFSNFQDYNTEKVLNNLINKDSNTNEFINKIANDNTNKQKIKSNIININCSNFETKNTLNAKNINHSVKVKHKSYNYNNDFHIINLCSCKKDDANWVCLKCNLNICEICKKKEHYMHVNEIIKYSKFNDYLTDKINYNIKKLNKIKEDDIYIYLKNFDFNYKKELSCINEKHEYLHSLIEELKDIQINYLIEIKSQLDYENKFDEINSNLKSTIDYYNDLLGNNFDNKTMEENNIDNNELYSNNAIISKDESIISNKVSFLKQLTPEELFKEKSLIDEKLEFLLEKFKHLKSIFGLYQDSNLAIENINKSIICKLKNEYSAIKTRFHIPFLNNAIQKLQNQNYINNKKIKHLFNQQMFLRFVNYNTVLCYKRNLPDNRVNKVIDHNIDDTFKFFAIKPKDNDSFKTHFQNSDEIELNIDSKLFIVTGKKYSNFFYYNYKKNEITQLEDLLFGHLYGGLFYWNENNTFYCIGGVNSKKCEFYRNDNNIYLSNAKNQVFLGK